MVLDASVLVRSIAEPVVGEARDWLVRIQQRAVEARAPDFVFVEAGHALARYARAGRLTERRLTHAVRALARVAVETTAAKLLAEPACRTALVRRLSVYDACYVVLAEASGAALVTADRRLAAATEQGVLIT